MSALRRRAAARPRPPAPRRWRCSTGSTTACSRAPRACTSAAAQLEAGEPERCLAAMRAGGTPDFADVEPGRRAWLYAVLARAELALGDRRAAEAWVDARRGGRGRASASRYAEAPCCCTPRAAIATRRAGDAARAPPSSRPGGRRRADVGRGAARPRPRWARIARGRGAGRGRAARRRRPRLLERAEPSWRRCGAARYRDEAARELRRLGARVGRAPAAGRGGGEGSTPVRPRARDRRAGGARAAPTARSPASCSCRRRPSRAT